MTLSIFKISKIKCYCNQKSGYTIFCCSFSQRFTETLKHEQLILIR